MKRLRSEEWSGKKVIDLIEKKCCGKEFSLEDEINFTKSQRNLHGFDGAADLTSVWGEHFPFSVVADEHLQSKADLDLLVKSWKIAVVRYMQATRFMCISQGLELQALEEISQRDRESMEKAAEKEKKFQNALEQAALKVKEIALLKEEMEKLNSEFAKLRKDNSDLEGRVVDLCIEKKEFEEEKKKYGFNMFAVVWDKAKAQAEFFAPGVKFEDMDPVKSYPQRELIDDDEVPVLLRVVMITMTV
ncbi:hypothetical protein PIB30_062697 [Stylosanthes scabra]|uniref:Uncharacterized protein n=1 Tax=Stylosanthes scabra TaxID=79078 RepID=A0ABU6QKN6_9FABA|nr:hypothetical protein [Stylosanthes scabra]